MQVQSFWVGKIPWRRKWQPTPLFLPGKLHEQRLQSMGLQRVGCILATKQDNANRSKRSIHLVPGATRGRLTAHPPWVSTESLAFAKLRALERNDQGGDQVANGQEDKERLILPMSMGPGIGAAESRSSGAAGHWGAKSKPCQGVQGCQQRKLFVTESLNSMALPGGRWEAPPRTMSVDNE